MTKVIEEYKSTQVHKSVSHNRGSVLDETRQNMKLHKYLTRGARKDIDKVREYFKASPSVYVGVTKTRNLYEPGDYRRIHNRKTVNGLTPLFLATMNGNLEVSQRISTR